MIGEEDADDLCVSRIVVPPSPNWFGGHLSDVLESQVVYCAHNSVVIADVGERVAILDIIGGHSKRSCSVGILKWNYVVYVVAGFLDKSIGSWKREAGLTNGRFERHRFLTKRPADVRAIACCASLGLVILGDSKGNLFTWKVAQAGSKVVRLPGCKQASDITSLACCPTSCHGIVAVGCRNGTLVACDFLNDAVIYEFKGHSKEVMSVKWTRAPGHIDRFGCKDATLLASSSQDCCIYVHLVTFDPEKSEKCEGTGCSMKVEESKEIILDMLSQKMPNRFWVALEWLPHNIQRGLDFQDLYLLYSSYNGRVVAWDAKRLLDTSATSMHDVKLPNGHSRAIFSLHCSRTSNAEVKIFSIGMDRICSVWNLTQPSGDSVCKNASMSAKLEDQILGFGSHPVCIALRPQEGFRSIKIAVGCGDATIRLVEFDESQDILSDNWMALVWKGIPAPVTSIAWNRQGDLVAFGCEDGSIGMFDAVAREVCLAEIRHPLPVTSLVWQTGDGRGNLLSVSNDGSVLAWPEADTFFHETKSPTKSIRMEHSPENLSITCTSPALGSTRSAGGFAMGHHDGGLTVIDGTSLNTLWKIENLGSLSSATMVACLEDNVVALLHSNGVLRLIKHTAEEGTILVGSTDIALDGVPTAINLCKMSWNGNYLIAIGFEDGKIGLYVSQEQSNLSSPHLKKLNAMLKGHSGSVLGLSWIHKSALEVPSLVSSSQDQSLRLWTISTYVFEAAKTSIREPSSESSQIDYLGEKLVRVHISTNNRSDTVKSKQEGLTFSAIKSKGKSGTMLLQHIFPSEDSEEHFDQERMLQTLTYLTKSFKSRTHPAAGADEACAPPPCQAVGLLSDAPMDKETADSFLDQIAHSYESPTSSDSLIQRRSLHRSAALRIWQGDVGGAIDTLVANGALTSDFVNFAAAAGREAWIAVVQAYVCQLEKSGDFHMAVLYLLTIGEDVDACLLYERHGMLRESAFLSITRLPVQHIVGTRLRKSYAHALGARGKWYHSAVLFISLQCWDEAVEALHKSQDPVIASAIERLIFEK